MRRPVKPFVTEYKGPNRRPPLQTAASSRRTFEDHGMALPLNESFSRSGPDHGYGADDSYEAALRAADALFSPNANKSHSESPLPETPAASDLASQESASGVPPRGGRILRVLDEEPVSALADLEEDRAPKRRGRKPGSKNKPKIEADSHTPAHSHTPARDAGRVDEPFEWTSSFPAAAVPQAVPAFKAATGVSRIPAPSTEIPATAPVRVAQRVKAASSDYAARNEARFAWVRTKLAPGEQWKRRLPKVCW
jgi:hypothetical protein